MTIYVWIEKLIEKLKQAFADELNNIRVRLSETNIALPIDIQYRLKEASMIWSGTATASGNTSDIDAEKFSAMEVLVKVTSVSGTSPTLQVCVQGKFDTTGDYKDITCTNTITTTGSYFLTINPLTFKTIRARWIIGGTSPSFTFRIDAVGTV